MADRAFRERVLERAGRARVGINPAELQKLEEYYQLLARWNGRINLTSLPMPGYPAETIDRLLVEPLAAARFVEDASLIWFDLGSGGGSPAIPLKIVRPRLRLVMVESRSRKAAFLREAVRSLDLAETTVVSGRVEELDSAANGLAELVTVRAVRLDGAFLAAATSLLSPSGRVILFTSQSAVEVEGLRSVRSAPLPEGGSVIVLKR
jgi:16S rRNA (guanine527-N7)-methyltransferase